MRSTSYLQIYSIFPLHTQTHFLRFRIKPWTVQTDYYNLSCFSLGLSIHSLEIKPTDFGKTKQISEQKARVSKTTPVFWPKSTSQAKAASHRNLFLSCRLQRNNSAAFSRSTPKLISHFRRTTPQCFSTPHSNSLPTIPHTALDCSNCVVQFYVFIFLSLDALAWKHDYGFRQTNGITDQR